MRRAAAVALAFACAGEAAAAEPPVCYGMMPIGSPAFAEPSLRIVASGGPRRLYFLKGGYDDRACPGANETCRTASYVTPGDPVVVGAKTGDHVCATFIGRKPRMPLTIGWLPISALADPPRASAPTLADWAGAWRSGDEKRISIKAAGGRLKLEGEASWGGGDPNRVASGAVHTGGFEATLAPNGASADFAVGPDGETLPVTVIQALCRVRLWRFGPFLVAADDGGCGGQNVTFTGVYRRD